MTVRHARSGCGVVDAEHRDLRPRRCNRGLAAPRVCVRVLLSVTFMYLAHGVVPSYYAHSSRLSTLRRYNLPSLFSPRGGGVLGVRVAFPAVPSSRICMACLLRVAAAAKQDPAKVC